MKWVYGVTTVPRRKAELLPRTIASLKAGGFDKPRLFVDGATCKDGAWYEDRFGLEVTCRQPLVGTPANWTLALHELFAREPQANRYAIFQDDFVTYKNLRQYLEQWELPPTAYWNLYTFIDNEAVIAGKPKGTWHEAAIFEQGNPEIRPQTGRGAVALVLPRAAVEVLLCDKRMMHRPLEAGQARYRRVDGAIVNTLNAAGIREYVHAPSLIQHVGNVSSMGSKRHPPAQTFMGEEVDAMSFL